ARDLVRVEVVLGVLHDLEPLRVRLHQAVLDPVVHHLYEVPRPRGPDVCVAVLRSKRFEDRLQTPDGLVIAPHHQAEADSRPQMPPETPASTKWMPCFCASS